MTQKSNNLYDLSTALAVLHENIMENDGVLSEEFEQTLSTLLPAITDKASNLSRWCINIDGNIDAIDTEITRLRKRKEVNDHLKERLKAYLKDCMEKAGLSKLDTGIMVVSVQKNPPSVSIVDEKEIPVEYELLTIVKTIDKKHLLEDLKAGKAISGVELKQGSHLRIR